MFAYLLIIAELFILASAYWYVFIREPRPFEIKENIWGYYDQTVNVGTGYGINGMSGADHVAASTKRRVRRVVRTGHVLLKSARHGVKRKEQEVRNAADLSYGWVESGASAAQKSVLSTVLAFLGDKLTQLSAKT